MPERRGTVMNLLLRVVGVAIVAHVLILHVPVSPYWVAGVAAVSALALLLRPDQILPLAVSLALTTLLLEGLVRLGAGGVSPYYRPHERLALDTSYRPGERVEMVVPHGDLLTIDPSLPKTLATPRREVFATDSFGHRNDSDYAGERLVIVGDSFLVGTDSTLGSVLRTEFGIAAYNVSFASIGPLIYADKITWVRRTLAANVCVALFFFEGNDFQIVDPRDLAAREGVPRGLQRVVKGYIQGLRRASEWSRTFFGLTTRVVTAMARKPAAAAEAPVVTLTGTVSGTPIVFLKGYADVVRRPSFDDHGFIRGRLEYAPPEIVFFVPDKFRVYGPLLDRDAEQTLPHAQWEYLRKAADDLGIPAVDLTPALAERARTLAASGTLTYWPDDTHWNRLGETAAAEVLRETLAASTTPACAGIVSRAN